MGTRVVERKDIRNGMRIMAADGTAVVTRAEYMWNHMMLVTCYGLTGSKQGREFNFTMINGDTVDALI